MLQEINLPDIGQFSGVEVIEVLVKVGDTLAAEAPILTLESDKASMEIPSPLAGKVVEVCIKVGSKISQGDKILVIEESDAKADAVETPATLDQQSTQSAKSDETKSQPEKNIEPHLAAKTEANQDTKVIEHLVAVEQKPQDTMVHAGPIVRQLANDFAVDLRQINGCGRAGRITRTDLLDYIKNQMQATTGQTAALPQMPVIDFSKFGPVEAKPLPRIKRLSATNLHRNWLVIPHVTHFDEADITELEAFRQQSKPQAEAHTTRLTILSFLMKAVVSALKSFPQFNSSLSPDGQTWYMKHYYHIGVAVETANGLVVPVIRDVDKKSLLDLAIDLGNVSQKARAGKLIAADMQGSSMSISSLGGIGGRQFTPIINAPDVAILGVVKAQQQPVWQDNQFVPRLMLPLALSYDHRVIDGAEAARFMNTLVKMLTDVRNLML